GRISADSNTDKLVFAEYSVTNDYYIANGWQDKVGNIHSFNDIASDIDYLVSQANSNREIILTLNWTPRGFKVILNNTDNPWAVYSTFVDENSAKEYNAWNDVASTYVKDATGNDLPDGDIYITYGTDFVIVFPETPINNYLIIGWSKTPYTLGDTGNNAEDIFYCSNFLNNNNVYSSDRITLNEALLGEDTQLVLYPVYQLIPSQEVNAVANNGKFTYAITNDDSLFKGFIFDATDGETQSTSAHILIELAYYQKLTITANLPNNNYILDTFEFDENVLETDVLEIIGNTVYETNTHNVVITYSPKEINVTLKLDYTRDLLSGDDTSTINVGTVTLSYANKQNSITIFANDTLDVETHLSTYFTLSSIKSGDKLITTVNNQIAIADLEIDESDNTELIFTLAPKSYNVDLTLQGGVLDSISYSSVPFGKGEILIGDNTRIQVIAGSLITVPAPVKEKCEFAYFMVNGTRYDTLSGYEVNSNITITAYFIQNKFTITYYFNNGQWQRIDFTGGADVIIGEGLVDYSQAGIRHIGWKDSSDTSASSYTYADGYVLTTEKKDYSLYEVVSGEDVTIEFVFNNGEETRTLVLKSNNTNTKTIEYSKLFTLPTEDDFTSESISVDNKALYGFTTALDATGVTLACGKSINIAPDGDIKFTYPDSGDAKITLYTVYYNKYTYNFNYTNTGTTSIESETYNVVAVDSTGSVLSSNLSFTLNATIPVNEDDTLAFAGYEIYFNGSETPVLDGDEALIVNAGQTISLKNPAEDNYNIYEYTYTLKAKYEQASGATELKLYITDPENESEYLKINAEGTEKDYYTIYAFLNNSFQSSSLPFFDYDTLSTSANWKLSSSVGVLFTTINSNFIAHKLLGFKCELLDADGQLLREINIYFDNTTGYSLAGAVQYNLTPIWENRYSVNYYDDEGNLLTSSYYDIGTNLVLDEDTTKYTRDGYVFVGYANLLDKEILSTNDFMSFGKEFTITNANYYFYPAFSKIYNVTFDGSLDTLTNALGDASKVETVRDNALIVYVGMPEVVLRDYYQLMYNDIGYTFAGFTLIKDKLANDLSEEELLENYSLDINHLVDNELTLYVAWQREELIVKFVLTARKNDASNSYADTTPLELTYRFNETINFDAEEIVNKVNSRNSYYEFKNFSLTENGNGITSYVVQANTTIYVNYEFKFTIIYNLGSATYLEGAEEVDVPKKLVGESLVGYDANANLFLEGRDRFYWSTLGTSNNFFGEDNTHTFTTEDTKFADDNYVINLYLNSSVANYTVNLYFFDSVANFDLYNKFGDTNAYSMVSTKVPYGSTILTVDIDYENSILNSVTSPFDSLIEEYFDVGGRNGNINSLYDLFDMFTSIGYQFNGNILVNNEFVTNISPEFGSNYYTVQTYSGADAYTNDIYLMYSLISYRLDVKSMVIADKDNITPVDAYETDDILTAFEINGEVSTATNRSTRFSVTRQDEINLIYMEDIAREYERNNYSYNFVGYYSATFNADESIASFVKVEEGAGWNDTVIIENREDGLYGGKNYLYSVIDDAIVYALYVERPVTVTVTYTAPDVHVDDLSTVITLNDNVISEDKFTVVSSTDSQKVFTFKALYGQDLYVTNSDNLYYDIKYFVISGIRIDNSALMTNLSVENGELTEFAFEVVFTTRNIEVYARTYADSDIFDISIYAEVLGIDIVNHRGENNTLGSEYIDLIERLNSEDNLYYNYVLYIPYGSTITSINAHLNNHTITGWETNGTPYSTITITESKYISAKIIANTIDVKYYASDGITEITDFKVSSINYGDKITLPYVVVDEDIRVSKGWTIKGVTYDWGETINAVTPNNIELEDNVLHIIADVVDKYYVIFKDETGMNFEIPEEYGIKNNTMVVTTETITISNTNTYYYYLLADNTLTTKNITSNTIIFDIEIILPEELTFEDNASFGGWLANSGYIHTTLYPFDSNDITNAENHIIELEASLSGIVGVKFYLTNPTDPLNASSDFKFATTASEDAQFTIPYIQIFYDKDNAQFVNYVYMRDSYNNIIEWGNGYFMLDTVDLPLNYTFYGWSATRRPAMDIPSATYSSISSDSALLYKWESTDNGLIRTATTNKTNNDEMLALLQAENYTFYAVWEIKHTITFDADDSSYTNGFLLTNKYSEGESVELPNNISTISGIYKNLINGNNKWLGWKSTDGSITYYFRNFSSGIFYIPAPSQDVTFEPVWTKGTNVYFDINFNDVRLYFAQVMTTTKSIGSVDNLLTYLGYPYLVADSDIYEYISYVTVNGKKLLREEESYSYLDFVYTTIYKEGALWETGSVVPVYKYSSEAFSQIGIFSVHAELDRYFDLIGWYYDANNNGKCDNGELITTVDEDGSLIFTITEEMINNSNGSLTLHAYWKPVDLQVEFYYDLSSAKNADTALRYNHIDEDDNYTPIIVNVPFGYKLTKVSDYATEMDYMTNGSIKYLYTGIASGMNNPLNMIVPSNERDFYRFNHWESSDSQGTNFFSQAQTTEYEANTISKSIINNVKLYPVFDIQYVVQFLSSTGVVLSNDITQYVITGETIKIKSSLERVLDTRIVREAYYLNNVDTKISVWSPTQVETLEFDESLFKILNKYYVNIYIDVNISIRAYIPDYSGSLPAISQYGEDFEIFQNYTYTLKEIFSLTDTQLKAFYGDGINYPSFAGWYLGSYANSIYYSDITGSAYRIDESNVLNILVMSEVNGTKTTYYAIPNNNSENKIALEVQDGGLIVCLYAKLYTKTTVSLGQSSNLDIIKFANIAYDTTDANIGVRYSINSVSTISEKIKSVTYVSCYYSPYAPIITVNPNYGYKISAIENIDSSFISTLKDTVNSTGLTYDGTKFKAIFTKSTTTKNDDNGTPQMKLSYTIKFAKILGTNGLTFVIDIDSILYNVTYTYDNTITSPLQYRTANRSTSAWQSFAENSTGSITFYNDLALYDNSIIRYNFNVNYTTSKDGDMSTIVITGVPYGASLYLGAFAIDTMLYHFDSWDISVENMSGASVGIINDFVQLFYPVLYNDTSYAYDINLFAVMELNQVKEITYIFSFNEDYYKNGSKWHTLLKQATETIDGLNGASDNGGMTYYTYTWTPKNVVNGLPNGYTPKAGESITDLLNEIKTYYDSEFNKDVSVIEGGNKIQNIAQLLNYFWFNNYWSTYQQDLDNKVCFLDNANNNTIKVSVEGKVTLYTCLEQAVLVNVLHRVKDYLDESTVITDDKDQRIDRADVALSENGITKSNGETGVLNTDFYLLGNNKQVGTFYNDLIVKLPYGYNITVVVAPVVASSTNVAYKTRSWSLLDCGNNSAIAYDTSESECTLTTKSREEYFVSDGSYLYPELHFCADVVAETYDLILYNNDGTQIGNSIKIAYDQNIPTKYINYSYSLSTLRTNFRLHLFKLDALYIEFATSKKLTGFSHNVDTGASNYGDYQYLFQYWSKQIDGSEYDENNIVKAYVNNVYADIRLYATYYENVAIDYVVLGDYDVINGNNTYSSYR
ncbi:MAG: hypothetical protein ACI4PF_02505, partial [Christensenellales bacterium]